MRGGERARHAVVRASHAGLDRPPAPCRGGDSAREVDRRCERALDRGRLPSAIFGRSISITSG